MYRNFCTKILNAARFINGFDKVNEIFLPENELDKWIDKELGICKSKTQKHIESYRLDLAINEVYEFFWGKFCDVYIEGCKKSGNTENLHPMLQKILVFMHPFAPFITEELHNLMFQTSIIYD